jgi:hypothetical protein
MRQRLIVGVFAILALAASQAQATPVLGVQLFYTGGNVTVTTQPVSSGFTSELGLYDASFTRLIFLVNDEPANVSATFDPSTFGINVGDELIFGIRVLDPNPDQEFFIGPASRNPDNVLHAGVDALGNGQFVVGFEDLFGGGDRDYDDNRFLFEGAVDVTPTAVPEPTTISLVSLGLLGAVRRRFRRAQ